MLYFANDSENPIQKATREELAAKFNRNLAFENGWAIQYNSFNEWVNKFYHSYGKENQ